MARSSVPTLIAAAIAPHHLDHLGGKARSLALLAQEGFPIPDWFVLPPDAFFASLSNAQQQQWERGDIEAVLATVQLSAEQREAVQQQLAVLVQGEGTLAVRSSALDEDGMAHSFAGQLESYLQVAPASVAEKIVAVWRSGFSNRIRAYRREQGLSEVPQPPAVLVQRMVAAQMAGVAFSADPVSGRRNIAVVSAVQGLGEALVSGEADAETWRVDRQEMIVQYQPLPKAAPILNEMQAIAIAQLARRAALHFGRPQDIEWAIDGTGCLWLLQSRPITTLANLADPDGGLTLWDNSNIAESYGGITTPLTFSFARRAYEAVYREFCRLMRVPEEAIANHDATFRCMLGLVRGRIYYNLLNWYRVLALLPGFQVNRRFMEQMMGVQEELPADVLSTLNAATFRDKLRDSLRLGNTILGLIGNYRSLPRQIRLFYQRLDTALNLPPGALADYRLEELTAYYHDLERQLLTRWDAPLINDFFAMVFYGVLRKLTASWCGDTAGTLQNDLISGEGGMVSAEPAQRVRYLASLAASRPDFAKTLQTAPLPQIQQALSDFPEFHQAFVSYLEKFGDRCLEELKLESATLHDDPLMLLRSIGNLAAHPSAHLPTHPFATSLRQKAEKKAQQALRSHPIRRLIFDWVLKNARNRVRDRENLRFERTRVFGRVRRIFLEVGQRLFALDALSAPRDVFYLNLEEILGFVDGTTTCTDLKGLVAVRQAEFDRYHQMESAGDRFATYGSVHPVIPHPSSKPTDADTAAPVLEESPDRRQGIGCCPGVVRAPVQVITDPKNAMLQPGRILVAERTDPGWILLFPAASGLLVERGSLLSHSAIVSREMGIPAIVSIPKLTQWLKDGDWIALDGSTGVVRRIEPDAQELLAYS